MKDINIQNQPEAKEFNKTAAKTSFLKKKGQKHYWIASGAILAIIVFHFVFQFSFIQSENFRTVQNLTEFGLFEQIERQTEQIADNIAVPKTDEADAEEISAKDEIETETKTVNKTKKSVTKRKPRAVSPPVKKRSKPAPARNAIKKKTPQPETRAERLRRAEKILTGV